VIEDVEAPTAAIVDPIDQAEFSTDILTGLADIQIVGEASDAGWGVASVELLIDGTPIPNGAKSFPPWTWSAAFPPGGYTLELVVTDLYGNSAESEPVHIGVDQEAPEPDPDPEPETETGTDEAETGDDDGPIDNESDSGEGPALDDGRGCGCTGSAREPGGLALLLLGGVAFLRRRQPLSAK
jgi:MYXO-CTERM domain-containing protein